MGEAFVALANDVNALNFNPAGLAHIRKHEISIMYLDSLVDTWFGFIGYAHPLERTAPLWEISAEQRY